MKTLFSILALSAMILTSSFTVSTQQRVNAEQSVSGFNYLRVHRQGQAGAGLTWSVANNQASHFLVERSYDGEFYDAVATVPASGATTYRHADGSLFPGYIYYRVTAVYLDGSTEVSPVATLRIVQRK